MYLGALIIYSILKIILKEREERKQQRLQENATSPAFASDDVQDVGSGADRLTLEQGEPLGTQFCWWHLKEVFSWGNHMQQPPRFCPPLPLCGESTSVLDPEMQKFSDSLLDRKRLTPWTVGLWCP